MAYEINYEELEKFWNWLRYGYKEDAYTEIKLMNINNPEVYNYVKAFEKENSGFVIRKNCQFFIKTFEELRKILEYQNKLFCKHTKICYSINPKFMINNDISGTYRNMKMVDMLFLDIEKNSHGDLTKEDIPYINIFINSILKRMKLYDLTKPLIVASGGGYHILYKLVPVEIDKEKMLGYKALIQEIEQMNTPLFKVDHMIDLTRCIALPETINLKRMKKVKIISIPSNPLNGYFIKSKKAKKFKERKANKEDFDVTKSLVYQIWIKEPPKGTRHTILLFAFKLLLKKYEYDEWEELKEELDSYWESGANFDPYYGTEGKTYNKVAVINWCKDNLEWCKENGIDWQDKSLL